MSSTRRASKRARLARRAENDQMRTARRDSLAVLLSRAQRGVPLTADEAALLRAAVEAEIREGDAARQAERGQQRAADRERVTAAEAAIVEAEERARVAEERAAQAEELQRIAHETSNAAERARAEAEQRLAAQHDAHDARRRLFADALGVDDTTTWPRLLDVARTAAHLAQRAEDRTEERDRALALAAARGDALAAHLARDRAQRCPSCQHGPQFHTDPAGCWFTVTNGKPDRDAVCGCATVRVTDEEATR